MKKSNKNHYVDNVEFLNALVEYTKARKEAEENGKPKPQVPDYVARCIILIAEKLSSKPNFYSYTFREEMVGDGIKNCIMYVDNFDPEKSSNPFAYFTQIIYYAFIQRIHKERKQLYVKYKSSQDMAILGEYEQQELLLSDEGAKPNQVELYDNINEFVENYEQKNNIKKREPKKMKLKKSAIENLFEDN